MSDHIQKNGNVPATHATQKSAAPEPGSPLQPGADGNPQAMPVAQPDPVMPERQPVKQSDDKAPDASKLASDHAASATTGTGNEDPGAEIEDIPRSPGKAGR